ncbi:NAD(P)/FAD-dependent oxidoreductase [Bradyrhizobium betae]|uniref:NAD(P)/FAD-dependent oxidoreductase n=1 Tax=Bradyrhizobium betae TaxID=244734 RepID=UPI001FCE5F1C|nr:FAD-dependent oxidoreductase [Bradyrhizobium betae]MCS3726615.1 glycine/D-amino acid oxidase-like deaminating enzyme [Bradyrhizobium betae]
MAGSFACDVLVVGAGITGAMVAESFTRRGHEVVIIDRETPGHGSTGASTAMLLWEIDRPLSELTQAYGFERAARCYTASIRAVQGLISLTRRYRIPCHIRDRLSLYLAVDDSGRSLREESELRARADLPGVFLDHASLFRRFEIARAGAILSPHSADADPVELTHELLKISIGRGAAIRQADATAFESAGAKVIVGLNGGYEIEANRVVLCTGYVMPGIVRPTIQRPTSSWAIATEPQPQNLWPEDVLIWEASKDYHYARSTTDGRIIFGGEDDDSAIEPQAREALTSAKRKRLRQQLGAMWPRSSGKIDYCWSGAFDTTQDGLPLIGPVPGQKNIFAAYGYGGNGITFSYLAAELLATFCSGGNSPLLDDFAIDRSG